MKIVRVTNYLKFNQMKKIIVLMLSVFFVTQIYAQDARYNYGPISGINLDDMLAIAAKTFENKEVKTERFNYSRGMVLSSNYNFTEFLAKFHNANKGRR